MRGLVTAILLFGCSGAVMAEVSWQPFILKSFDGREIAAQLVKLPVAENRAVSTSRTIDVAVVRLPAATEKPGSPIVFLSGGPGVPATGIARVPVYFDLFESLRSLGDVILLDQRGSGLSTPNLSCPETQLQSDAFLSDRMLHRALLERVKKCSDYWGDLGADLSGYNTVEIAADVDAARQALNVPKVRLVAFSYGSEVALTILRRYPSTVERVVFASTRGPDNVLKFPSIWDAQLQSIGVLAGVPLLKKTSDLVRRLETQPIELARNGDTLRVGAIGLLTLLRTDLPDGRAIGDIPALVRQMDQGDYIMFTKRIEQLYKNLSSSFSVMPLAVDCSSGWSGSRLRRTRSEARRAVMRNVNLQWHPQICAAIVPRSLGPKFRTEIASDVPALFVTGTLDVNAPIAQAEAVRRRFPNSIHVHVENGTHETLPAARVQRITRDFLAGKRITEIRVVLAPPEFQ